MVKPAVFEAETLKNGTTLRRIIYDEEKQKSNQPFWREKKPYKRVKACRPRDEYPAKNNSITPPRPPCTLPSY